MFLPDIILAYGERLIMAIRICENEVHSKKVLMTKDWIHAVQFINSVPDGHLQVLASLLESSIYWQCKPWLSG